MLKPVQSQAPVEPTYATPGWRFLTKREAIGYFNGRDWVDQIDLPPTVEDVPTRELIKRFAKSGVRRGQRDAQVRMLREADRLVRVRALMHASKTEYADAVLLSAASDFKRPIMTDNCIYLVESRKGARGSERHGSSSYSGSGTSVGIKGVRLGVNGGSSSSYSRTVSYPALDELTIVDSGNLVVTVERATFTGRQFTRNAHAGRVADISFDQVHGEVSIHPTTGTKTWHLLGLSPLAVAAIYGILHLDPREAKADPLMFAQGFAGAVTDYSDEDAAQLRDAVEEFWSLLPRG